MIDDTYKFYLFFQPSFLCELMYLSNYCQGLFDVFSWPLMLPCKRMHSFTWNAAGSVVLYYLQGYFMISSLVLVKSLER